MLGNIPPAHTDTDIYIKFQKANVLHLGDVFFNGMYPFIDAEHRRQHRRHDQRRDICDEAGGCSRRRSCPVTDRSAILRR